jgi:hypothetical protein
LPDYVHQYAGYAGIDANVDGCLRENRKLQGVPTEACK